MHNIKTLKTAMAWYGMWSAAVAVLLLTVSLWGYTTDRYANNDMLFGAVLALFHGIFSIWFWQGKQLLPFVQATIISRIAMAILYGFCAWQASKWGESLGLSAHFVFAYIGYLMILNSAVESVFKRRKKVLSQGLICSM